MNNKLNLSKINSNLNDIKSLISILQNRVNDLELIVSNYEANNIKTSNNETKISNKEETTKCLSKNEELKSLGEIFSDAGLAYELQVYNITKLYTYNINKLTYNFNNQTIDEVEDLSKEYDILCNWTNNKNKVIDIPIELKKYKSPDWGQCNLQFNKTDKIWEVSNTSTISDNLRTKLNNTLKEEVIFRNEEPIFFKKKLTTDEWYDIKNTNPEHWTEHILDIPFDFISEYYTFKGNKYIQISHNLGLYYLGKNDICNFGVPQFNTPQKLRIRVRKMRVRSGYIKLVVTASASPINNCSEITKSPYSLDNHSKIPKNLHLNNKKS